MDHPCTAELAAKTIARLNDEFHSTFEGRKVLTTAAVNALPVEVRAAAIVALQAFTVFTPDNDPHKGHDFGRFELAGEPFFWKIDYCDETCTYGCEDPCDPDKTTRVLTPHPRAGLLSSGISELLFIFRLTQARSASLGLVKVLQKLSQASGYGFFQDIAVMLGRAQPLFEWPDGRFSHQLAQHPHPESRATRHPCPGTYNI
jgi:Protein of unknown function (DUF3768)